MYRATSIIRVYTVLIASVFSISNLQAQKLSVETIIDTNRIVLGDQIGLEYQIIAKNGILVKLPVIGDTLTEGVEVIGEPRVDSTKLKKEGWEINLELVITSFDTGIYYIPQQAFVYNNDMAEDTLFSRATYLEVIGVAIDTTNTVRDIKGPEAIPVTIGEVLKYIIPIWLLVGLIVLGIWFLTRRKVDEPLFKPLKPEEPAYITALRELDKIKAQKLWQKNLIKEYHSGITHIVRWYIEKRFHVQALEQISSEILRDLQDKDLDETHYSNLEKMLHLADEVKFAKGEPDPDDNITQLENAYLFIKQTRLLTEDKNEEQEKN